jgi:hypothetical protein
MITQGLSNTIYGISLMETKWKNMPEDYKNSVYDSIAKNVCDKESPASLNLNNAQAIANIIYSLGISGAEWSQLTSESQAALNYGIIYFCPAFSSQEVSNLIYG